MCFNINPSQEAIDNQGTIDLWSYYWGEIEFNQLPNYIQAFCISAEKTREETRGTSEYDREYRDYLEMLRKKGIAMALVNFRINTIDWGFIQNNSK